MLFLRNIHARICYSTNTKKTTLDSARFQERKPAVQNTWQKHSAVRKYWYCTGTSRANAEDAETNGIVWPLLNTIHEQNTQSLCCAVILQLVYCLYYDAPFINTVAGQHTARAHEHFTAITSHAVTNDVATDTVAATAALPREASGLGFAQCEPRKSQFTTWRCRSGAARDRSSWR
jgi:hypothetical protein